MNARSFHIKIRKAGCVFLGAVLLLFAFLPAAGAQVGAPDLDALIVSVIWIPVLQLFLAPYYGITMAHFYNRVSGMST